MQAVGAAHVVEEDRLGLFGRAAQPVKIRVLTLPVIRAQARQVALISENVSEFKLPEEAFERRVSLAFFLPGFDGDADVSAVLKSETDHGMGDVWGAPVNQEEIHGSQAGKSVGLVIVAHIKIC